jgi:3-methylfumaryl-CoA hydratase
MNDFLERTEILLPEPARALGGLLGVPVPDLEQGAGLPLLWHWVYLLDRPAQADLGPDGCTTGGPVPAVPGRRRMWAGGQVRASGPLRCGEPATKRTRLQSVREKRGRSGPLTFIVMEHQIWQRDRVVIEERQDLVYRAAAPRPGQAADSGRENRPHPLADSDWAVEISPALLFRFSALTYNAHRIHYDRDYARDAEGYPGLLTHGPLQALAMAEAARGAGSADGSRAGDRRFGYRLTAPLFDHQGLIVSVAGEPGAVVTAVRDTGGRQTATGTLRTSR